MLSLYLLLMCVFIFYLIVTSNVFFKNYDLFFKITYWPKMYPFDSSLIKSIIFWMHSSTEPKSSDFSNCSAGLPNAGDRRSFIIFLTLYLLLPIYPNIDIMEFSNDSESLPNLFLYDKSISYSL